MEGSVPEFNALSKIEEDFLIARLQAARKSITHSGEKGRSLEKEVSSLIKSFLPAEYGLSTGFVVYHSEKGPELSSQLDIIIYDPIRSGPIARLSTCDVFPLEAVFGYIEVKATLQSSSDNSTKFAENSIETCLEKNKKLRGMIDRRFWTPIAGSSTSAGILKTEWLPIRSYVFSFEAQGTIATDADKFAQRMADYSSQLGPPTHLHGVFIAGQGYFKTRAVDPDTAKQEDYYHIQYTKDHAFAAFKSSLLHDLARFPRFQSDWNPAIDQYFQKQPLWQSCTPVE